MLTKLGFLELSKVFDSISYPILLHKLNSVDILYLFFSCIAKVAQVHRVNHMFDIETLEVKHPFYMQSVNILLFSRVVQQGRYKRLQLCL